jgi:predicted metal-dependent hydrolase
MSDFVSSQDSAPLVEVQRSRRRRRTISAYWQGESIVVQIPSWMSRSEEATAVSEMVTRLTTTQARRRSTDDELHARAIALSAEYFDARAVPTSVVWSQQMSSRWGSCTIEDRTIRLSARLKSMPSYVQEYVLVHELAHLLVADHSPEFWEWVRRYPQTERATGYLEGWSEARDLPQQPIDLADEIEI